MENGSFDKHGRACGALKLSASAAQLPPGTRVLDPTKEVKYKYNYRTRTVEADNLEIIETAEQKATRTQRTIEVVNRIQSDLIWQF